jgi:hypothetical protein
MPASYASILTDWAALAVAVGFVAARAFANTRHRVDAELLYMPQHHVESGGRVPIRFPDFMRQFLVPCGRFAGDAR